jgi:hypothetical protein
MTEDQYPIRQLTITTWEKPLGGGAAEPKSSRFVLNDLKGPRLYDDGPRGRITSIGMREHAAGAEFTIWVENDGAVRPWGTISSHVYDYQRDLKE